MVHHMVTIGAPLFRENLIRQAGVDVPAFGTSFRFFIGSGPDRFFDRLTD